jgi:hypothetical protein
METGDHPGWTVRDHVEEGHRKYQMLIGILVQVVTIGRIDVLSLSSLSRFTACQDRASGPSLVFLGI